MMNRISQLRNEANKGSFETAKDIWQYIKDNFEVEFREDYVPKLANRIGLSYKKTKPVSGKTLTEEVQKSNRKNKWTY